MNVQALLKYIDNLVFTKTGKHLNSLQVVIIKGVLNRQKYTQIAEEYNCSAGHCKDQAYQLWRILSEAFGEDLNKSNFRATIERLLFANCQFERTGNREQGTGKKIAVPYDSEYRYNINLSNKNIEILQRQIQQAKLASVPALIDIGLTSEQIARALELPIEAVKNLLF